MSDQDETHSLVRLAYGCVARSLSRRVGTGCAAGSRPMIGSTDDRHHLPEATRQARLNLILIAHWNKISLPTVAKVKGD